MARVRERALERFVPARVSPDETGLDRVQVSRPAGDAAGQPVQPVVPPRFPAGTRDLSFWVAAEMRAGGAYAHSTLALNTLASQHAASARE